MELTTEDHYLIDLATKTITTYFELGKHRVATVLLTADNKVISGINVEGSFGCIDVCAEQITLGKALSEGYKNISCVVSVKHPKPDNPDQTIKVVSPCGQCRELLYDYAPEAWVIVRDGTTLSKVQVKDLLPFRYSKV